MSSDFYQHPDLYDALLPVGAHLPFYCDLARNHPEGVLELACGTGQLAVPITGLVAQVVGLDRSTAMLRSARATAADVGVACTFVEGDMRHFNLEENLDLIFIARNSLLHVLPCLTLREQFLQRYDGVDREESPTFPGIGGVSLSRDDGRIVAPSQYMDSDIKEEFTAVRGGLQNVSERVREVDVRVREVDTSLSTEIRRVESMLRQEIREDSAATRRHFDVVAESVRDDIRIIAEGLIALDA